MSEWDGMDEKERLKWWKDEIIRQEREESKYKVNGRNNKDSLIYKGVMKKGREGREWVKQREKKKDKKE